VVDEEPAAFDPGGWAGFVKVDICLVGDCDPDFVAGQGYVSLLVLAILFHGSSREVRTGYNVYPRQDSRKKRQSCAEHIDIFPRCAGQL